MFPLKMCQSRSVPNSCSICLSSCSLSSASMLEKKSSLTSSPMPSRDSRMRRWRSFSWCSWASSSMRMRFCLYSWGVLSWLLMSCTMGWCLLEVVRLGKYFSLLRPSDWFSPCFGRMLWKDLCSKAPSLSSAFFSEEGSLVLWLSVRPFAPSSSEDWQLRSRCRQHPLSPSFSSSFPGDFTSRFDRFSISCGWTGSRRLFPEYRLNALSPVPPFRAPMKSLSGDRGRNSALPLAWSKRLRSSSMRLASARRGQSSLSQSLKQVMMLRTMAASPSGELGRQILTWFSSTSGLIQQRMSRWAVKKTMFSLMMKKPQRLASCRQAASRVRAQARARSSELSSLRRSTDSLRRSSVHTSWVLPSSLPTISLGVPSMWFSSRRRYPSRSFPDFSTTRWHTRSLPFITIINHALSISCEDSGGRGSTALPCWLSTFSSAQGWQRQGLRAISVELGCSWGFQPRGGCGGGGSSGGQSLLMWTYFSILVSEQQQAASPSRVRQQHRERMLPMAVYSLISLGSVTSASNFFCMPTLTPGLGLTSSQSSSSLTLTLPSWETLVTLLMSSTQKECTSNCPLALSMKPLILKGWPYLISFFSTSSWKMPEVLLPMHFQHSDVQLPDYDRLVTALKGSLTLSAVRQLWASPCASPGGRVMARVKLMALRGARRAEAGREEGRRTVKGKEQCPRFSPPSNLLSTNSSPQVLRELRQMLKIFSEDSLQATSSVPMRLRVMEGQAVSSSTSRCAVPSRYCPAQMMGVPIWVQILTLLSLFVLPIILQGGVGWAVGAHGVNYITMSTLPVIRPQASRGRPQYLRFPTSGQGLPAPLSLEQQTQQAVGHSNFLYIDFQAGDRVLQLQPAESAGEESEQIGGSRIGGFEQLSRLSPPAYRMHKYLSEEQLYLQRKEKWSSLLRRRGEEGEINFPKVREHLNPQKLSDYLQNKHNETSWRKIHEREQRLLQELSQPLPPSPSPAARPPRSSRPLHSPLPLKALPRLNALLQRN